MPRLFRISDARMEAFSKQQAKRFEDEMVVYLQNEYPAEAGKYTEKVLRDMICDGNEKPKGAGRFMASAEPGSHGKH